MSVGSLGKRAVNLDQGSNENVAGQVILLSSDVTSHNHAVSNTDTDITTALLAANKYTQVRAVVTGTVEGEVGGTSQPILLKIKDGVTQEGQTQVVQFIIGASVQYEPFIIIADWVEQNAVTIHITQSAAVADASSIVYVSSVEVFGIV